MINGGRMGHSTLVLIKDFNRTVWGTKVLVCVCLCVRQRDYQVSKMYSFLHLVLDFLVFKAHWCLKLIDTSADRI